VAMLLAVASELTRGPRLMQSVLFVATAAEEQGLWGSRAFVARSPRESMVANINIDGINVWGQTRDVRVVGRGRSWLDEAVSSAASRQGRVADRASDNSVFYRSDQFAFSEAGVPAITLGCGHDYVGRPSGWGFAQHQDFQANRYHQAGDAWRAEWSLAGAVDDVLLVFDVAREAASSRGPLYTQ
jgi:Zn-dependent M28 family amino/carboxypeptidase